MSEAERDGGALEGIRVIEVCQNLAGPYCCTMLADMGADVIKVEPPAGDHSRHIGRHFTEGESHAFMNLNRSKRSIVIDLKNPEGKKVLEGLVAGADVLVENNRPGMLERMGLGYEDLRKVNPKIIYATISGYGRTGPMAERGGYDLISQGFSSLMSFTGEPGRPPAKIPVPICDLNGGMYTAFSVLSALLYRNRTGKGQRIDTSLTDAGLGYTVWHSSQFFPSGEPPVRKGSAHEISAPYQAFRSSDGYFVAAGVSQPNWERMCQAIGRPDLIDREEYATPKARGANYLALADELQEVFENEPRDVWIERLEGVKVPCGPIHDMKEAFDHPQIQAREMAVEVDHPKAGRITVLGVPPKLSESPGRVRRPAPLLGQHTDEILHEIGKSGGEIQEIRDSGGVA
jgi:crotonobetainyl-CoA:carnitine CoA-transferase CaiB-like acyl-CoA transferase